MDFEQLQALVMENIDLIEVSPSGIVLSKERAAKFLTIQALLSNHLKMLQDAKAKVSTLEKATYAQAIVIADGKNITEKKVQAEANPQYSVQRENLELIDSEVNWTKQHYDIFANAHVMFRQYSRE